MTKIWRTPVLGELLQMLTNRRGFVRALRLFRAIDIKDFRGREDALRNLAASVPSLMLWANHDPCVPARFAESFGAHKVEHFPTVDTGYRWKRRRK